jgi:hypothetical protein
MNSTSTISKADFSGRIRSWRHSLEISDWIGISQQVRLIPTFPIEQLDVTFDDARDQLELEYRQ